MEKDIKQIRNHVNMSQRKFADYFNIPLGTFRNWEQGISKPPEYVLNMIIESIRRDKMINVETIKFVKMLDTLATLTKGGIFEFKNATENDYNSLIRFYYYKICDAIMNLDISKSEIAANSQHKVKSLGTLH